MSEHDHNPVSGAPSDRDRELGEAVSKEVLLGTLGKEGLRSVVELNTGDDPDRAEQTYPTLAAEIEETEREMFREQGVDVDDDDDDDGEDEDPLAPEEPRPILEQWMTGEPEAEHREAFLLKHLEEVNNGLEKQGGPRGYGTLYGEEYKLNDDAEVAAKLVEYIRLIEDKQGVFEQLRGFGYDWAIMQHMAELNEAEVKIDDIKEYCKGLLEDPRDYDIAYPMVASINALRQRGVDMDAIIKDVVKNGDRGYKYLEDHFGDFIFGDGEQFDLPKARENALRRLNILLRASDGYGEQEKKDMYDYVLGDSNTVWGMVQYQLTLKELEELFKEHGIDTGSLSDIYQEMQNVMDEQEQNP